MMTLNISISLTLNYNYPAKYDFASLEPLTIPGGNSNVKPKFELFTSDLVLSTFV